MFSTGMRPGIIPSWPRHDATDSKTDRDINRCWKAHPLSCLALSGRFKFTVRRHTFEIFSLPLSLATPRRERFKNRQRHEQVLGSAPLLLSDGVALMLLHAFQNRQQPCFGISGLGFRVSGLEFRV